MAVVLRRKGRLRFNVIVASLDCFYYIERSCVLDVLKCSGVKLIISFSVALLPESLNTPVFCEQCGQRFVPAHPQCVLTERQEVPVLHVLISVFWIGRGKITHSEATLSKHSWNLICSFEI